MLITSFALSGCPRDFGDAVRETCAVDDDCENAVSYCLPAFEGDSLYDFCDQRGQVSSTVCPESWKDRTEKGMVRICDVDSDQDGIADVTLLDNYIYGKTETCGFFGDASDTSCGRLSITGLGDRAPCSAFPGLVDTDGVCLPPDWSNYTPSNNNNNNNNTSPDAGVTNRDSGTNNTSPDSGTNNNPVDSGTNNNPPDSGTNNNPPDAGVPAGPRLCTDVYSCFVMCIDSATDEPSFQACQGNCRRDESSTTTQLFNDLVICSNNNGCSITLGDSTDYSTCMDTNCMFEVDRCLSN